MTIQQDRPATRTTAPMTGDEYIESLRDGREIWLYGERVKDVTDASRPSATRSRMTARLYDALHDPASTRRPDRADRHRQRRRHPPLLPHPALADDLVADRDAIATWARMTYGWMGRSPDYKASLPRHARRQHATSTRRSRTTRGAGTASRRRRSCTGTTRSSIRRSTATVRRTRSATCSCRWRRRPTPA